jgi:hypothetical protein
VQKRKKSADDIRIELEVLAETLFDIREQQVKDPDSIRLKSRAAVLHNEIEARRLLLATLFPGEGAA